MRSPGRRSVALIGALVVWQAVSAQAQSERAEATLVPGAGGFVSTFRVLREGRLFGCEDAATPCSPTDADLLAAPTETVTVAAPATLGWRVSTERAAVLRLFVGVQGRVGISLDGAPVVTVEDEHLALDADYAELTLAPGAHTVTFAVTAPTEGNTQLAVRVVDAAYRPGSGDMVMSLGRLEPALTARTAERALRLVETRVVAGGGIEVGFVAERPGGGVVHPIDVSWEGQRAALETRDGLERARAASWPAPARGDAPRPITAGSRTLRIGSGLGPERRVAAAVGRLREAIPSAPESARAPLQWRAETLAELVATRDPDARYRDTLLTDALTALRALDRGRDLFAQLRGYVRMAYFSKVDGACVPYELFVPPGRGPHALVVTLHGYKGNAGDYFRNTFGLARPNDQTLEEHGRNGVAPSAAPMVVVAPTGRGSAHYRFAGEADVLEVIADVSARLRIDPRRVHVTGGSMGGTGAAYLALRHPDRFASVAALAGYHDQRVRADTDHAALGDLERFLLAERSDVDWAENGLYLPFLLVRGTRDLPLDWTRSLARRLTALHADVELREPPSGHNVWTETYADGAIFRWFGARRIPLAPRRVRLRTARSRHDHAYWIEGVQRARPDAFGEVDARVARDGAIEVTATEIARFTIAAGAPVQGPARVRIDGALVEGPLPLHLSRTARGWETESGVPAPRLDPIRDVYGEPLLFVLPTLDPTFELLGRLTARAWAHPDAWDVAYPVVRDVELTDAQRRDHVLVLIGPPRANAEHARLAARLPIHMDDAGLDALGVRHTVAEAGPELGVVFVARNPDVPTRPVLVLAGPTPVGTWRSTSLPELLPDYVVYDARVAPAHGRFVWSGTGAAVRAAGFW